MIAENKWRAIKDGVKGKLIDFGKQAEVSVSELASELIELVDDVLDPLEPERMLNTYSPCSKKVQVRIDSFHAMIERTVWKQLWIICRKKQ